MMTIQFWHTLKNQVKSIYMVSKNGLVKTKYWTNKLFLHHVAWFVIVIESVVDRRQSQ